MTYKDIESAKKDFIEAILSEYISTLIDDGKTQEKSIKRANKIQKYIKENFDLKDMIDLLDHDIAKVQIWTANLLLPVYEEIALKLLEDISQKEIPHCSYNAKMMLFNWRRNN